ncbi:MAG: signal peptidase I [Firmicutes bacterium]|nr:signal peptidase I [Bacillota bacterium]
MTSEQLKGKDALDVSASETIASETAASETAANETAANETAASSKTKKKGKKEKKPKKQLTEKQKTVRALRRLITKIVIVAAAAAILLTWVGSVAVCHDNNMFPAVRDGDLIITYKLGGYYNDDIVLYNMGGIRRIGRVVAIPGDVVDIDDNGGFYTLNGTMPYETIYFATRKAKDSTVSFPYTVQEGEVFIFNDMRDDTYDSRMFGGVSELEGKVVLLIRRRGF